MANTGTKGVNSLPKTVTRHRRGCDLNPGPSAPESSTLTTRLPSRFCFSTDSEMPHRCCHLLNKIENIDRTPDIPYIR